MSLQASALRRRLRNRIRRGEFVQKKLDKLNAKTARYEKMVRDLTEEIRNLTDDLRLVNANGAEAESSD